MSRNSRRPAGSSVPILTAALCLLLAPAARGADLLCDGVVVDREARVAFSMSPSGGVEAIDLATGEIRWSSDAAAKPLHLAGGLLIAQGEAPGPGAVRLAALAADSGASRHGMTVELAAGVWTGIDDGPGRSFRCHVGGSPSSLAISWREARPVDNRFGVAAPALDESSGPVIAATDRGGLLAGGGVLDLVAGRVASMDPARVAAASLSAPVDATGTFLADVEGRQRRSADGAHVLASVRTGAPGEWQKYAWSVYTAAGELVGTLSHHAASAPFVVSGTTLVFRDQPYTLVVDGTPVSHDLTLRGVDLASGDEIWSRPLRDTAYRGPFRP